MIVVGGGPAGLAAALELRRRGIPDVTVLDRERDAGGIPRHAQHQGFGLRDLHRSLSGPQYARRYLKLADQAGVDVLTETMVTGWGPNRELETTSPRGRELHAARAVLLATGCRERPRPARLVPGSRPQGVMTTGMLQQLVYLHDQRPGTRALIVGAEHVSYSALLTLAHAGTHTIAMITSLPRHQSFAAIRLGVALRWRTPLWTRTELTRILGHQRVEAVELRDLGSGTTRELECDTVVFTGDWIPDHELAVLAGIDLDQATRGPAVDTALRTSGPGVFAAGNLLHGAETADIAALSGRHAAAAIAAYLTQPNWPQPRLPIHCVEPLHWVAPNVVTPASGPPPCGHYLLRSHQFLRRPSITIRQDDRTLWNGRLPHLRPGRSTRLPWPWTTAVDFSGGPIRVAPD